MKRHTRSLKIAESINMTPLLDITFLLLIVFMLIAPELKHGIKVNLPKTEGGKITPEQAYLITVRDDGRIYLNGRRVDFEELIMDAQRRYRQNPQGDILLEGDTKAEFGVVLQIFGALKEAGVEKVQLMTEPRK